MSDFDLLVRASKPDGSPFMLGISEGKIRECGPDVAGTARETIESPGDILLPGWIDAHVHFNEPGRADWEGITSGSRALALGGGTAFFDMPLNSTPPVLTAEALFEKRKIAEKRSCLDFALWGGLVPESLPHLEAMGEAGAIGFKAFLCHSGLDEFPKADPDTLRMGMETAQGLSLPVSVHAEMDPTGRPAGGSMRDWLDSRPKSLELEAIGIAIELAGETGCALHIVHVSCPEGIDLVTAGKADGVDVTAETCPHYLLLDADDAIRIGASAKCAPPLHSRDTVEALRERLRSGEVDTIGSDHSPSPPGLKESDDMFENWGGIAGIQHGLPLLLDESLAPAALISGNVARRFRLAGKGSLSPGHDADFILVRRESSLITAESLVTSHPISPYIGRCSNHRIVATFLRGEKVSGKTTGKFLQPSKQHPN